MCRLGADCSAASCHSSLKPTDEAANDATKKKFYWTSISPEPVWRSTSAPPFPTLPWICLLPRVPCMVTGWLTFNDPEEVRASILKEACDGNFRMMLPEPAPTRH